MHKFTKYEHLLIRQALLGIPETFPIESSPGESTSWIAVVFLFLEALQRTNSTKSLEFIHRHFLVCLILLCTCSLIC